MTLLDKVVVVTGAAHGIGRALALRSAAEGAAVVAVADSDAEGAAHTARDIPSARAYPLDVRSESALAAMVEDLLKHYGHIDLFCSNAGIALTGAEDTSDADWDRIWRVNVLAHVYAARAVLPSMLARGRGYLLQTVSAAGLLSQIGSAPYAVTKHAALAFAEWLAITYGGRGINVSALCPQGVLTAMLDNPDPTAAFLRSGALTPDAVASAVVDGLASENFLILPHPEVAEFFRRKAANYDRWLAGMRRLQASLDFPSPPPAA